MFLQWLDQTFGHTHWCQQIVKNEQIVLKHSQTLGVRERKLKVWKLLPNCTIGSQVRWCNVVGSKLNTSLVTQCDPMLSSAKSQFLHPWPLHDTGHASSVQDPCKMAVRCLMEMQCFPLRPRGSVVDILTSVCIRLHKSDCKNCDQGAAGTVLDTGQGNNNRKTPVGWD